MTKIVIAASATDSPVPRVAMAASAANATRSIVRSMLGVK